MEFRILHISDVHFQEILGTEWIDREKIKRKIRNTRLKADCIVISGDLFNKGSLSEAEANNCKTFIEDLKRFTAISIDGQQQNITPIVLVVPGNHDLDRSARTKKQGSFNRYNERSVFLRNAEEVMSNNQVYNIPSGEKRVLYQCTFDAFRHFATKIGSVTFSGEADEADERYEVQIADIPIERDNTDSLKVRFVLLNTALFAGQCLSNTQLKARRAGLNKKHKEKLDAGEYVEAAKLKLKIAQEQAAYEEFGNLIIDEESFPNGNGRLGLSTVGQGRLRRMLDADPDPSIICTFFVGHHGLDFLTKGTVNAISEVMAYFHRGEEGRGIYLCGHAHRMRHEEHETPNDCELESIHQIQAGTLFSGDDFSEYGFNYITITPVEAENSINITAEAYFRSKNHSGREKWLQELLFTMKLLNPDQAQPELIPANHTTGDEKFDKDDVNIYSPTEQKEINTNLKKDKLASAASSYGTKKTYEEIPSEVGTLEEDIADGIDAKNDHFSKPNNDLLGIW